MAQSIEMYRALKSLDVPTRLLVAPGEVHLWGGLRHLLMKANIELELRGLRIPVATIVALVAEGQTTQEILALYPDLETEDVREALLFAAEAVDLPAAPAVT